jgi:hypothetical protein
MPLADVAMKVDEEKDKKVEVFQYMLSLIHSFSKLSVNISSAQKVYTQEDLVNAIRYGTKIHINYIVDQDKSIVNKYGGFV